MSDSHDPASLNKATMPRLRHGQHVRVIKEVVEVLPQDEHHQPRVRVGTLAAIRLSRTQHNMTTYECTILDNELDEEYWFRCTGDHLQVEPGLITKLARAFRAR